MLVIRRGTDAERAGVTFAEGEFVYTTDLQEVWIGDGATAGGIIVTGAGGGTISDVAWDPTSWNTNLDGASKNAIRDIIVAILAKVDFVTVTQAVDLDTIESDTAANNAKVTNATHTGEVTGSGVLTVDKIAISGKTLVTAASGDHLLIGDVSDADNLKKVLVSDIAYPAADATKVAFITVTQTVDLDTLETDTAVNNAKVTNATHTGEVTGATVLTVDKTAITNRTLVTALGTDHILIADASDSDNLKKALLSDVMGGSGANTALSNLAAVAINAALELATSDAFALGSTTKQWSDLFLAEGAVINWDNGDAVLTQTGNTLALTGAGLDLNAANDLIVPVAATPTPTADGTLAYGSTRDTWLAGGAGGLTGSIPRVIAVGHPAESKTNSTGADQDYTTIFTIPANYLIENRVLRVTLTMQAVTGVSTVTVVSYLKIGATKVVITTALNFDNSVTRSSQWSFLIHGTTAAGAAAAVETGTSSTWSTNSNSLNSVTQPVNLATNGTLAITPGVTFSGTGSTETLVIRTFLVEELN